MPTPHTHLSAHLSAQRLGQHSPVHRAWMLAVLCAAAAAAGQANAQASTQDSARADASMATAPAPGAVRVIGDDDIERERLATIAAEIAHLQALVQRSADGAPAGQRVRFRYDWLVRDLQLVREGVEQHADAQRQPRPVPALRGDYRQ